MTDAASAAAPAVSDRVTPGPQSHITTSASSATVWHLAGELDLASVDMLLDDGSQAVAQATPGPVIVDLSGVSFIDSAAAEAIETVRVVATLHGRTSRIRGARATVARVFRLLGLDRQFGLG